MDIEVRPAGLGDVAALRAIAADGGSPDSDDQYFGFVRSNGQLTVATRGGDVAGFAGAVPLAGAVMVSDLFVAPRHRALGVGRRLLDAVLHDQQARLTFSSTHPAALRLYTEFGMVPTERLLTMRGRATGGGPPLAPGRWQHGRPELVSHFGRSGAIVTDHFVVRKRAGVTEVLRVDGQKPQRAIAEVIAAVDNGDAITLSILESHPMVAWLERQGFEVIDDDVWCRSPHVARSTVVTCVHRGLC